MKNIKFYINKGLKGNEIVSYSFKYDFSKEEIIKRQQSFIDVVKEDYPDAKSISILVSATPKIDKKLLMGIGQEVASSWGAVCTGVKTYLDLVCFECNEYGEPFVTYMSYDEIKKEYIK